LFELESAIFFIAYAKDDASTKTYGSYITADERSGTTLKRLDSFLSRLIRS